MPYLVSAHYKDRSITFPANFTTFRPRLTRKRNRLQTLPGLDGAFDPYAGARAQVEAGQLRATLFIPGSGDTLAALRASVVSQIDTIYELANFGTMRLEIQFEGEVATRFCWARIANMDSPQETERQTDALVEVEITFDVPDGLIYKAATSGVPGDYYGGGSVYNTAVYGEPALDITLSGPSHDQFVSNDGNAPAAPYFLFEFGSLDTSTFVSVQRIVRTSTIADEIRLDGNFAEPDIVEFDVRSRSVLVNGVDAYSDQFSVKRPQWLELVPGSNRLRFQISNSTSPTVRMDYEHAYRR